MFWNRSSDSIIPQIRIESSSCRFHRIFINFVFKNVTVFGEKRNWFTKRWWVQFSSLYSIVRHHICLLFVSFFCFLSLTGSEWKSWMKRRASDGWKVNVPWLCDGRIQIYKLRAYKRSRTRSLDTQVSFHLAERERDRANWTLTAVCHDMVEYHVKNIGYFCFLFIFLFCFVLFGFCLIASFQFNARPIVVFMHGLM